MRSRTSSTSSAACRPPASSHPGTPGHPRRPCRHGTPGVPRGTLSPPRARLGPPCNPFDVPLSGLGAVRCAIERVGGGAPARAAAGWRLQPEVKALDAKIFRAGCRESRGTARAARVQVPAATTGGERSGRRQAAMMRLRPVDSFAAPAGRRRDPGRERPPARGQPGPGQSGGAAPGAPQLALCADPVGGQPGLDCMVIAARRGPGQAPPSPEPRCPSGREGPMAAGRLRS